MWNKKASIFSPLFFLLKTLLMMDSFRSKHKFVDVWQEMMFLFCVLKYRSWYDRKRSKSRVDNCRVRALVTRWWNRVRSSSPALTLLFFECRKEIVEQRTKLKSWKRFLITQFFFQLTQKIFSRYLFCCRLESASNIEFLITLLSCSRGNVKLFEIFLVCLSFVNI